MTNDSLDAQPNNWEIRDKKLDRLCKLAWERLPTEAKKVIVDNQFNISDTPEWNQYVKQALEQLQIKWNCARFNPNTHIIELSIEDCMGIPESVITGSFVHELAHAYQAATTPRNLDAIEEAGDSLPVQWGFSSEIEALKAKRDELNSK